MIRSLITSFFLVLFLFPMVEKELHAMEHHDDEHCAEHELMHLHEKDHICNISDFTFDPVSNFTVDFITVLSPLFQKENFIYHGFDVILFLDKNYLRGPPNA